MESKEKRTWISGNAHLNVRSKSNRCDALRDLVPFVQFKKREKHPGRSVNFSKGGVKLQPATLLKLTLLPGCFSCFLNCTNGTKSCNVPQWKKHFNPSRNHWLHCRASWVCVQRIKIVDSSKLMAVEFIINLFI